MPVSLDELDESCRGTFLRLFDDCAANGTPMRPYFVVRDPFKQAELWRQSRSTAEIEAALETLEDARAVWLASVLRGVGPQYGRWATNALPGNSWHQWSKATDAYAEVDGEMSWDTVPGKEGGDGDRFYRFYAERAAELGLTSLGPSLGDWVHVQESPQSSPRRVMPWTMIDAEMKRRFGT